MRSPRRGLCSAILALEGIALGLTTPVLITLTDVPTGASLGLGLGLALVSILLTGFLRYQWAYTVGWLVQVLAVAMGLLITPMFFLGGVFAALWATAIWLSNKIDRERAEAFAAYEAEQAAGGATES
ncbi:DUF4233 domain-containing protein [Nocardioides bruguierae]|uniref:DUF4233 domain-containing protein n=1 Tax=Nocardioides bruguierae TaxID=2945102 RepID=A0A9X2D5Z0_9ACTN|nr:DUF4233 domain-containing protein [Nocardioides bruguierae]MCL8026479.1 DUF4233 domain-containing protein [Nocardioides bruguierae]MCM0619786.1 DUF4233 domain-containing protein [Nocardioides bruguierae]